MSFCVNMEEVGFEMFDLSESSGTATVAKLLIRMTSLALRK